MPAGLSRVRSGMPEQPLRSNRLETGSLLYTFENLNLLCQSNIENPSFKHRSFYIANSRDFDDRELRIKFSQKSIAAPEMK